MQFKLAKSSCALWLSLFLVCEFAAPLAHATTGANPLSPYVRNTNSTTNFVNYAVSSGLYTTQVIDSLATGDTSFRFFDFTKNLSTDSSGQPNMLLFNIVTTQNTGSPPTNQRYVIAVTVNTTAINGTSPQTVPIARVNDGLCGTVSPDPNCINQVGPNYYAVYSNLGSGSTTTKIGLYLNDICQYGGAALTGFTACVAGTGFNSAGLTALGQAEQVTITFNLFLENTTTVPTSYPVIVSGTTPDTDTLQLVANLSNPTLTCPTDPAGAYFPGESSIILDTNQFTSNPASYLVSIAPASTLMLFANQGTLAPGLFTDNEFSVDTVKVGSGSRSYYGFKNSTNEVSFDYAVGFSARDEAGVLTYPATCSMTGVKTSAILGFLKKSQCFIATAAFRSDEGAPLELLRAFRDQVLLQTVPGKAFVHWYYNWSPSAAVWLIEHPTFRWPVLTWLVPFEVLAWVVLHPIIFGIAFCSGLGLVLVTTFNRRSRTHSGKATC